jgi:hypothetical protein
MDSFPMNDVGRGFVIFGNFWTKGIYIQVKLVHTLWFRILVFYLFGSAASGALF